MVEVYHGHIEAILAGRIVDLRNLKNGCRMRGHAPEHNCKGEPTYMRADNVVSHRAHPIRRVMVTCERWLSLSQNS